ncbi:MAG: hypothetical protein ACLGI5_12145 [Thermoleophilia bacterium]
MRKSLQLDAAFIAEFVDEHQVFRVTSGDEHQVFRVTSGDGDRFEAHEGGHQAPCNSNCTPVVDGVFPNLVADVQQHGGARSCPPTRRQAAGHMDRPPGELSIG